jgi:hypothetical protein
MPFTEITKKNVKRRAHFQCCLCRSLGVEVHHIVPQADGGSDLEGNAAYIAFPVWGLRLALMASSTCLKV